MTYILKHFWLTEWKPYELTNKAFGFASKSDEKKLSLFLNNLYSLSPSGSTDQKGSKIILSEIWSKSIAYQSITSSDWRHNSYSSFLALLGMVAHVLCLLPKKHESVSTLFCLVFTPGRHQEYGKRFRFRGPTGSSQTVRSFAVRGSFFFWFLHKTIWANHHWIIIRKRFYSL